MLSPIPDLPVGLTGLSASHTVLAADVDEAIAGLAPGARLLAEVGRGFDGYMAELVAALLRACGDGRLSRCALVVPDTMLAEAQLAGAPEAGGKLRGFPAHDAAAARRWVTG